MKKTCERCISLETGIIHCSLGYKTKSIPPHGVYVPAEECPKPKTIKVYVKNFENLKKHAHTKI